MNGLSLRSMVLQFVEAMGLLPLLPVADVERGLTDIEAELFRLAADVQLAEVRGVPLYKAANDEAGFPSLFKFHVGVRDILTMQLPSSMLEWARQLLNRSVPINGDEFQLALGRVAASTSDAPILRSLARLLLFEGVRCSMLMIDHVPQASTRVLPAIAGRPERDAAGMEALGVEGEALDEFACREVEWWVEQAQHFAGEVRPFSLLTGTALVQVREYAKALQGALSKFNSDVAEEMRVREELERKLKRMDAADAVLLRNVAGRRLGEQRVSIDVLRQQHEVVLGSRDRNALNQHLFRLCKRSERGDTLERKSPALVDLVAEQLEKEWP